MRQSYSSSTHDFILLFNVNEVFSNTNFNQNINHMAVDTDLVYNYCHSSQAKQYPTSLLIQLYIDDIGLTNSLSSKRDDQLEDLLDTVKSIGGFQQNIFSYILFY